MASQRGQPLCWKENREKEGMQGTGQVTQRPGRAWPVGQLQELRCVSSGAEAWGVEDRKGRGAGLEPPPPSARW